MKIGTEEVKEIEVGETRTYSVNPKELNSARVIVSYVQNTYPELGKRYKTKSSRKRGVISITAISL
jgi:hypothetical protein